MTQLTLPLRGYTLRDNHPRDHIYRELARLGAREEAALVAYEEAEWADFCDTPADECTCPECVLDRANTEARTFHQTSIAPHLKGWWL